MWLVVFVFVIIIYVVYLCSCWASPSAASRSIEGIEVHDSAGMGGDMPSSSAPGDARCMLIADPKQRQDCINASVWAAQFRQRQDSEQNVAVGADFFTSGTSVPGMDGAPSYAAV